MRRLTRDGIAQSVARDEILRRGRAEEKNRLLCSANHEQDWQPSPVDLSSAKMMTTHTYIQHTYIDTYDIV